MKNQHRYGEISADRSVPIPLQPPHLLQFDTLMFPYRNEKLTSVIILYKMMSVVQQPLRDNVNLNTLVMYTFPVVAAKRYSLQKGQI